MTRTSKELLALTFALGFAACNKATRPTVTFLSPVDGATLTADAGTVTGTTLTITVTAATTGINTGAFASLTDNGMAAGTTSVSNGLLTFSSIALAGSSGGTANVLVITVGGVPLAMATVTVVLSSVNCADAGTPTVAFTLPLQGASLSLGKNDENGLKAGLQTPLKITTSSQTGSVEVCSTVPPTPTGPMRCGFNPSLFHVGSGTVSASGATLDATTLGDDSIAPNLNQTLTAQVTDSTCGTMGTGTLTVEVHSLTPVIDSITPSAEGPTFDGGFWLNSTTTGQISLTVAVDPSDIFVLPDGGTTSVTVAITGAGGNATATPLTGTPASPTAMVPISMSEGASVLGVSVVDAFGNPSDVAQLVPVNVSFEVNVKTTLPTCTLTGPDPTTGCFNVNDNLRDNDAGVSSGSVNVPIQVNATNATFDINGFPVDGTATVTLGGGGSPTSSPIATVVTVPVNSDQGANVYTATVTDPAGNPAQNCTPATLDVDVSTVPPALRVAPQSGGSYATRDSIPIVVDTTDIPAGPNIQVQIIGTGGNSAVFTGTVAADSAALTLSGAPNGMSTVVASGTDQCGNSGSGDAGIDVTAAGCDLTFVGQPIPTVTAAGESLVFGKKQVSASGMASIEFHTSCLGTLVQFTSTPTGGIAEPQTLMADAATGLVTFDLSDIVDGSSGTFSATANGAGGEMLPIITYFAKLTNPVFTGETPAGGDAGTLEIVANQDNLILSDAGVTTLAVDGGTVIANEAQCTTTACADFTLTGVSGLGPPVGNNIGTAMLALDFPGFTTSNPNPINLKIGTPVTFPAVAMPAVSYPSVGTVTLTLIDNAGNTTTETWDVTTDSLQPLAPALTAGMSDKRAASVQLNWTVPATGGDSPTQGYEAAYGVYPLGNTTVTGQTPSEKTYASWTLDPTIKGVNGAVGAMLTHVVSPPFETLNQYTFELRAIDAVGNRSPPTTDATAFSVASFSPSFSMSPDPNAWQTLTITENDGNEGNSDFGYVLRTGDFNGDGMQDLVITAPYQFASSPTPGIVYIMNGDTAANLAKVTFAGLDSRTLSGDTGVYDFFGQDAHVADFNGDGIDDLVVGAPYYGAGQGRIDIFFGHKNNPNGLSATPDVTIFGDSTQIGYFGYSVSSADIDGDGIQDLLVGAPGMGTGSGSIYVFLSPKKGNNWPASTSNPNGATSIISGNAGDGLGAHSGTVPIGDINSDGDGDFAVGAPGGGGAPGDAGSGTEYGISGASVLANTSISVSSGALFTLVGRSPGTCGWGYNSATPDVPGEPLWECYGVGAIGDIVKTNACNGAANCSFTGGNFPDLVVSSAFYSSVYLYTMAAAGPVIPAAFSDDEGFALGWTMVASDINTDGHPDLLVGPNDTTTGVYLYLNTGKGLTTQPQPGGVPGQLFSGEIPSPDDSSYFGYGVTAGDYQGIGKQDFAISDDYPAPYVNVYY